MRIKIFLAATFVLAAIFFLSFVYSQTKLRNCFHAGACDYLQIVSFGWLTTLVMDTQDLLKEIVTTIKVEERASVDVKGELQQVLKEA